MLTVFLKLENGQIKVRYLLIEIIEQLVNY